MNEFLIKYSSGVEETLRTELSSVEAVCNQVFGMSLAEASNFGAEVSHVCGEQVEQEIVERDDPVPTDEDQMQTSDETPTEEVVEEVPTTDASDV